MQTYNFYQELFWPFASLVFLWGLVWGSFFNVCIYRIPRGKSISFPGSHCYHCGSYLKWYDNIPLVSYVALGGVCRSCGTSYSIRYFFVELLTGLLFVGLFVAFRFDIALPFHMAFVGLLVVGVFTDIDHFIIPDRITIGGAAFAFAVALMLGRHAYVADEYVLAREIQQSFKFDISGGPRLFQATWLSTVGYAVFSGLFAYGMLWLLGFMGRIMFRKEALGMGDVKLFAFLGVYMGAVNCIWILFLSAFIGATAGISLLLAHKLVGKDDIETITLGDEPTVESRWIAALSQPTGELERLGETSGETEREPVVLNISRRTSRQLHHFPYGPYIAIAAYLVLVLSGPIHRATRNFLLLP